MNLSPWFLYVQANIGVMGLKRYGYLSSMILALTTKPMPFRSSSSPKTEFHIPTLYMYRQSDRLSRHWYIGILDFYYCKFIKSS